MQSPAPISPAEGCSVREYTEPTSSSPIRLATKATTSPGARTRSTLQAPNLAMQRPWPRPGSMKVLRIPRATTRGSVMTASPNETTVSAAIRRVGIGKSGQALRSGARAASTSSSTIRFLNPRSRPVSGSSAISTEGAGASATATQRAGPSRPTGSRQHIGDAEVTSSSKVRISSGIEDGSASRRRIAISSCMPMVRPGLSALAAAWGA